MFRSVVLKVLSSFAILSWRKREWVTLLCLLFVVWLLVSKLKRGCTGSSESTFVKMPHCWKSHVTAHIIQTEAHKVLNGSPETESQELRSRPRGYKT